MSRQFYPQTATTHLQFFRYSSSSNPIKFQLLSKINKSPYQKTKSLLKVSSKNHTLSSTSSTTTWLNKWNQVNKNNSPKKPRVSRDYRESDFEDNVFDTGIVRVSGGTTMERIVEKLKKFGYSDDVNASEKENFNEVKNRKVIEKGSVEDIFYVEDGLLPNTRGGFSPESPLGVDIKFPWEKEIVEREEKFSVREKGRNNMAELTLPEPELRRLRIFFSSPNKH